MHESCQVCIPGLSPRLTACVNRWVGGRLLACVRACRHLAAVAAPMPAPQWGWTFAPEAMKPSAISQAARSRAKAERCGEYYAIYKAGFAPASLGLSVITVDEGVR